MVFIQLFSEKLVVEVAHQAPHVPASLPVGETAVRELGLDELLDVFKSFCFSHLPHLHFAGGPTPTRAATSRITQEAPPVKAGISAHEGWDGCYPPPRKKMEGGFAFS